MIIIRADANGQIGAGHIMRCLSIAQELRKRGEEPVFVTADHNSDPYISRNHFRSVCLDSAWDDMESELPALISCLRTLEADLMIIDSYQVTDRYFNSLSETVKTVYIDDMNKDHWDVDALIDYNIFAAGLDYSWYEKKGKPLLLGLSYVPLRAEFQDIPSRGMGNTVKDILISAGGADPQNISEKIMREICPKDEWKETCFRFVIGALNPRIEELKAIASEYPNIILHINEKKMSQLMMRCDLAVSAAGSTLYELCACGVPTITYTLADNQKIAADYFGDQGLMINAGDCRGNDSFIANIDRCLKTLSSDKDLRERMSKKMQSLVDGRGAGRIADYCLKL